MSISTIRHDYIFNPRENNTPISIVGAGATGSRVFMALIELGLTNITVYDFDKVEAHNLANQAFTYEHIGMYKVEALADLYKKKTGNPVPASMKFITEAVPCEAHPLTGSVFLLTDTMASRREIFEKELKNNPYVLHVYETRMASTHGNVLTFNPNNMLDYRDWVNTLVDDSVGERSPCGGTLSVGTTASIIANLAVWQFMHRMTNPEAADPRIDVFLKPTVLGTGAIAK